MPPAHPGEVLLSEFLSPFELYQEAFADYIDLPVQGINGIVCGKRSISSEIAWLCAEALDTNPLIRSALSYSLTKNCLLGIIPSLK